MVTFSGQTTNFTGKGSPNPNKLVIPRKDQMDQAERAAMLSIEQWANNLVTSGAFTQISHTYAVSGVLSVPSGATGYLPPFFMPAANQETLLYAIVTEVRAGSCTLNIEQNGSVIISAVAVTTAETVTPTLFTVANFDSFQPVITAVSGADGLSCSFFFAV